MDALKAIQNQIGHPCGCPKAIQSQIRYPYGYPKKEEKFYDRERSDLWMKRRQIL